METVAANPARKALGLSLVRALGLDLALVALALSLGPRGLRGKVIREWHAFADWKAGNKNLKKNCNIQ